VETLSIGEVARLAGIRASAIRYYESAGLLPVPPRASGQRRYEPRVVDRLALIRFAQDAGFTVAEIRTLFEGFDEATPMSERWQALARQKMEEADALIARAQHMKALLSQALSCGCLRLEDCASHIGACNSRDPA
jgi:MerR family redox-sensitive transcriptional activator SoxR